MSTKNLREIPTKSPLKLKKQSLQRVSAINIKASGKHQKDGQSFNDASLAAEKLFKNYRLKKQ